MSGEKRIFRNFIVEIIYRKTKPETHLQRPICYRDSILLGILFVVLIAVSNNIRHISTHELTIIYRIGLSVVCYKRPEYEQGCPVCNCVKIMRLRNSFLAFSF